MTLATYKGFKRLCYCKPGDNSWTDVCIQAQDLHIEDITICKKKIYVIDVWYSSKYHLG